MIFPLLCTIDSVNEGAAAIFGCGPFARRRDAAGCGVVPWLYLPVVAAARFAKLADGEREETAAILLGLESLHM